MPKMRRRLFFIVAILFIVILMPLHAINSVSTKDKDKSDKVKDKEKIIKEKENNGKKIGQLDAGEKLKSDLIYSEVLGNDLKENKNDKINISDERLNINDKIYFEKKSSLERCLTSLEGLQMRIDEMKRETKIASVDDMKNIKSKYMVFDGIKESFDIQSKELQNSLNESEKDMIKVQNDRIEESNKALNKLLLALSKDMDKKNLNNKELFENTKKIEEEIKIIYRQLRAIEWIISN